MHYPFADVDWTISTFSSRMHGPGIHTIRVWQKYSKCFECFRRHLESRLYSPTISIIRRTWIDSSAFGTALLKYFAHRRRWRRCANSDGVLSLRVLYAYAEQRLVVMPTECVPISTRTKRQVETPLFLVRAVEWSRCVMDFPSKIFSLVDEFGPGTQQNQRETAAPCVNSQPNQSIRNHSLRYRNSST